MHQLQRAGHFTQGLQRRLRWLVQGMVVTAMFNVGAGNFANRDVRLVGVVLLKGSFAQLLEATLCFGLALLGRRCSFAHVIHRALVSSGAYRCDQPQVLVWRSHAYRYNAGQGISSVKVGVLSQLQFLTLPTALR